MQRQRQDIKSSKSKVKYTHGQREQEAKKEKVWTDMTNMELSIPFIIMKPRQHSVATPKLNSMH